MSDLRRLSRHFPHQPATRRDDLAKTIKETFSPTFHSSLTYLGRLPQSTSLRCQIFDCRLRRSLREPLEAMARLLCFALAPVTCCHPAWGSNFWAYPPLRISKAA